MSDVEGHREVAVISMRGACTLVRAELPTGERVLVKSARPGQGDNTTNEQLIAEYELGVKLDHPHLPHVLDLWGGDNRPALVLADDGGTSLRDLIASAPLTLRSVLTIATGIASGLVELHRLDIIHREISPDTVTVSEDGRTARIIDLGMATVVPRVQPDVRATAGLRGSLPYISPEQTGRTSRPIDFRTDLYSLGITLFEMLVGAPPFTSPEPLDLVHEHLAVRPPKVSQRRPRTPRIIDELVAKLLEKDPNDRYRSAAGVLHDLEAISDHVVRGLDPDSLSLEGIEISTRFRLPDQLFGRDEEIASLHGWLDHTCKGNTTLVLVHGYSGVGKSSLIEALRPQVNALRGYQTVGKFDQLDRGSAQQAVAAALRELVRHLLMDDNERIAELRSHLLAALGDGAGALVEMIPELAALLGDVPAASRLDADGEGNRFQRLVSEFLSQIATPGRPLVIVLDDLQWADGATLDFIERVVQEARREPLLLIGAYRDNEVDHAHPVQVLRRRLAASGVVFGDIGLQPLSPEATGQLVAAATGRSTDDAAPLTDVCVRRTGSNPFFVRLFLRSLYEDGVLQLDLRTWAWSWDMEQIAGSKLTDNMVDLAVENIGRIQADEAELLIVMSIIGTEGDAELLEEVGFDDAVRTLRQLASQELVNLLDRADGMWWQFAHDRIQEAAYTLFDEPTRLRWHARLGDALERRLARRDRRTSVFAVLRHRNEVARTGGPDLDLARLNLEGGRIAMRSAAYDAALRHFATGARLLPEGSWQADPTTAFGLHLGAADAARLSTDFGEMARWLALIDAAPTTPAQRHDVAMLRILYHSHVDDNREAVEVARRALGELGWKLPGDPGLPTVVAGLARTRLALRKYSTAQLEQLPVMQDPTAQAMSSLLNETLSAAYFADPNVMALMIQQGVRLSVRHGNDPATPMFYAAYGMVLAGIVRDPDAGVQYADLAVRLADHFGVDSKPSRVRFTRDTLVSPFTKPLREIEPSLERAYRTGLEIGDLGYGTGAFLFLGLHRLFTGTPLERLEPDLEAAEGLLRRHAQLRNLAAAVALRQFVHDVRHLGSGAPFSGPYVTDGDEHVRATATSGNAMAAFWTAQFRAMSRFHHGDHGGAADDLLAAAEHIDAVLGQVLVPVHHLYGVLVHAELAATGTADSLRTAEKHRKQLAWFAKHNPVTHGTPLLLADAAIALARGDRAAAVRLSADAITAAAEQGTPLVVALAAGVAAASTDGDERRRHLAAMDDAFRRWGADALVSSDGTASSGATVDDYADLDVVTVVRAAEAISGQVELDALITSLMDVTLRSAGAERSVLFRVDEHGLVPEAEGRLFGDRSDVRVLDEVAADGFDVAEAVVRLVARTTETVIAARAVDDPTLRTDETVQRRGIRSLMCLPLVNQGTLQGVLYFENNQVDGAFTPQRRRLLQVLSSQAASALEKARLHDAQQRLIAAQHKFVPVQFLQSLGHTNLFDVELGEGVDRDVDILFTDIRKFTTHVEKMSPGEAVEFLNDYLAHMEPVVQEYGGFIDAFGGDSILALFESGRDAGLRAALDMAAAERRDNERRARQGLPPVHTGFGLNTDVVMLGILGGVTNLRATIIGDAANLASRVQDLTKRYGTAMLLTQQAVARLTGTTPVTLRPLELVQVVGKTEPIRVFEVLEALDEGARERRLASLPEYRAAMEAYDACDLPSARERFDALTAADPDDAPAATMLRRVRQLIDSGEEFDGPPITRLETK